MPSIRFRLDRPPADGLASHVAAEYGPEARILDTRESLAGGLGGLLGKRVIEVTVDVPDRPAPEGAHEFSMRSRVGLAALLDDADAMDLGPATAQGDDPWAAPAPGAARAAVSTQGGGFASVLDALRIDVEPAGPAGGGTPARPLRSRAADREPAATPTVFTAVRTEASPVAPPAPRRAPAPSPAVGAGSARKPLPALPAPARAAQPAATPAGPPTPAELAAVQQYVWATATPRSRTGRTTPGAPPPQRTRAGDLLLLVGVGEDPVRVARSLRDRLQRGYVCDGGRVERNSRRRVDDRRGAVAARAYGVRSEQPVIVAYGVGADGMPEDELQDLLSIDSDQAWLVVDADRDAEETARWTEGLRGRLQIDAVATLGAARGDTPHAVAAIGLPEVWREPVA